MSAPNTTPGPWVVNPFCAQVDCGTVSKIGGLLPVCQMLWPTDERSEAETEANAHLIAASQDMYDALERADKLIENLWEAVPWGQTFGLDIMALNEVPLAMKRALSRARGEVAK